nr:response regulator PleD [Tanacetum cinerariifolium]
DRAPGGHGLQLLFHSGPGVIQGEIVLVPLGFPGLQEVAVHPFIMMKGLGVIEAKRSQAVMLNGVGHKPHSSQRSSQCLINFLPTRYGNCIAPETDNMMAPSDAAVLEINKAFIFRTDQRPDCVENVEGIQALFIYDAQGNWIVSSFPQNTPAKNNSDRAYFAYHREHTDESIHIGSIVESRTTGDKVIPISRRINAPDGTFAGVALATVPVDYFQTFFERMDVDDKGVIFLALNNGDLLARRPTLAALMTTNLAKGDIFSLYLSKADSGTAVIQSVVDGVERIYAYRRVAGLPIVVAAGVSCEHVFAPWWAYAWRSMAMIGLIIAALGLLGMLLYRQIQQLMTAERELNVARGDLEVIAQTDSLTLMANRRCFDTALQKEWARAGRNNSSLAIILLDIDWFKQYNDHYGHLQGDECLKQVARVIGSSVNRASDLAARYGGEEFVVLLPETDLAGAMSIAEKIRLSIVDALIEHSASPIGNLTIKVDRLLYSAKTKGRNRVEGRSIQASATPSSSRGVAPLTLDVIAPVNTH